MIYVVLGIIVLVVSFVFALISLVYEQRKLEKKQSELDEESGLIEANRGVGSAVDSMQTASVASSSSGAVVSATAQKSTDEPLNAPDYAPSSNAPAADTHLINASQSLGFSDDGTWWKRLEKDALNRNEKPQNEEDKSIEEIRLELSKMISNKVDVGLREESVQEDFESRNEQKKKHLLAGEFSLGDIKNKD